LYKYLFKKQINIVYFFIFIGFNNIFNIKTIDVKNNPMQGEPQLAQPVRKSLAPSGRAAHAHTFD
jgi:hypothetical protein